MHCVADICFRHLRIKLTVVFSSGPQRSTSADRSEEGDDEAEGCRGTPPLCACCMARVGSRTSTRKNLLVLCGWMR